MNSNSPGDARNNKKVPCCERHDAFLTPQERAEFAARVPVGHEAQLTFLLAHYDGNVSVVAALLDTRAGAVRRRARAGGCRSGHGSAGF
ncbi:hypothetical protein [Streptomyces hypolithicus]